LLDLVDDGFSDEQFFAAAVQIVAVAYGVADSEDVSFVELSIVLDETNHPPEGLYHPSAFGTHLLFVHGNPRDGER